MSPWAAVFVEPSDFCNAFFATSSDQRVRQGVSQSDINPFADLLAAGYGEAPTESQLRVTVTKAVNDNGLVPGLKIYQCDKLPGRSPTKLEREEVDPDAFYFELEAAQTTRRRRSWADQIMPVWFETSEVSDVDVPTRMMAYADLLFAVQQRVALFMLVFVGSRAQFLRWDRSGAIVTEAFDYVEDWRFLCDALWRIGHCSAAQLGFDPTATRIYDDDPDYATMLKAAHATKTVDCSERVLASGVLPAGEFEYVRQLFEDSLVPGWPQYRVKVPVEVPGQPRPESEKTYREFLIGKPAFRAKGMVGRGTRGYVALDCETKRFRWLKDAWRSDYEIVEREGEILAGLNKAKVVNVPTMLCHGDIGDQRTETPAWWERQHDLDGSETSSVSNGFGSEHTLVDPSSSKGKKRQREDSDDDNGIDTGADICPLRLHRHYRLVVEEVGLPLDRFQYPRQLVHVIFDCVIAHEQAATIPERPLLHRDISSGNMLMYPRLDTNLHDQPLLRWGGILADWELSKPFQRDDSEVRSARQPVRTGTWQYLSVALLTPGRLRVGIADEIESFFHVLLYYALRYVKSSNCSGSTVANFLDRYFDFSGYEDSLYICGDTKRSTIERGILRIGAKTIIRFHNPLDGLFAQMMSWFNARYIVQAYEDEVEAAKKEQSALNLKADTAPGSPPEQLFGSVLKALAGRAPLKRRAQTVEPPSDRVRKLAEQLQSHNSMVYALATALCAEWPEQKAEDQIASE